jgi:hypothetical protein
MALIHRPDQAKRRVLLGLRRNVTATAPITIRPGTLSTTRPSQGVKQAVVARSFGSALCPRPSIAQSGRDSGAWLWRCCKTNANQFPFA